MPNLRDYIKQTIKRFWDLWVTSKIIWRIKTYDLIVLNYTVYKDRMLNLRDYTKMHEYHENLVQQIHVYDHRKKYFKFIYFPNKIFWYNAGREQSHCMYSVCNSIDVYFT